MAPDLTGTDLRFAVETTPGDGKTAVDIIELYLMLTAEAQKPRGGWKHGGLSGFLMANGRYWGVPPRSWPGRWPARQCYQNAFNAARRDRRGRLRYVEGIAMGIIPVHHAWCVDAQDHVIDPTWPEAARGRAYFGCVFEIEDVAEARMAGSAAIFGAWAGCVRLFKEGSIR
jgi:hypothetical protein